MTLRPPFSMDSHVALGTVRSVGLDQRTMWPGGLVHRPRRRFSRVPHRNYRQRLVHVVYEDGKAVQQEVIAEVGGTREDP